MTDDEKFIKIDIKPINSKFTRYNSFSNEIEETFRKPAIKESILYFNRGQFAWRHVYYAFSTMEKILQALGVVFVGLQGYYNNNDYIKVIALVASVGAISFRGLYEFAFKESNDHAKELEQYYSLIGLKNTYMPKLISPTNNN
jgi:hypothetical protein